ncbi:hypothetical protein HK100_006493, partial [Physocladia obscura]
MTPQTTQSAPSLHRLVLGGNGNSIASVNFSYASDGLAGLTLAEVVEVGVRPSWVHIASSHLITNSEDSPGRVLVYALSPSPSPSFLAHAFLDFGFDSGGADPCYMSLINNNNNNLLLLAANYSGGTVSFTDFKSRGRVSHVRSFKTIDHPNPHPHQARVNPFSSNQYIYIPDLGSDRLHVVSVNHTTNNEDNNREISSTIVESLAFPKNSGPRHIDFHPNGKIAYLNLELSNELAVISLDPLEVLEHHSILPIGTPEDVKMQSAAIALAPDAKYVYLSNRYHPSKNDTVVRFFLDASGIPSTAVPPVWTNTQGVCPRGFAFSNDPAASFLCVVNQESDNVVMFKRNAESGALDFLDELALPAGFKPTCVVW